MIAMPQLLDPNFHHTVVVLAEYSSEGAFGLVVNRKIDRTLGQVERTDAPVDPSLHDHSIWYGGPVELDNAMVLFEALSPDLVLALGDKVSSLGDGLHITGNTSILTTHAELLAKSRFKVIAGHADWGMAQLDSEIAQSSWLVAPLDRSLIFSDHDSMWTRAVQSLGVDPTRLASPMSESDLMN